MATAKKLPSGSWRVQLYDYTDDAGKRHYKSFTAPTKKEAELAAAMYNAGEKSSRTDKTFGECAKLYVANRLSLLSPSTIKEYNGYNRRYMKSLSGKRIMELTQDDVQKEVNKLAQDELSPKTVRNVHGFISAVLAAYRPEFALHTVLPKKIPPQLHIPTEAEIQRLMAHVAGTKLELPILLAAFGPMRRGEICALRMENIKGRTVHVCENMVLNSDNEWIIKAPKSYSGDRFIEYPQFVAKKWKGRSGRIVDMKPSQISDHFDNVLKKAGLPHFRFHDLRHFSASIQHAMGIPDAYIMQRGGWKNDGVLKQVYRHAMSDQAKQMSDKANEYFENMQHEISHEIKKAQ